MKQDTQFRVFFLMVGIIGIVLTILTIVNAVQTGRKDLLLASITVISIIIFFIFVRMMIVFKYVIYDTKEYLSNFLATMVLPLFTIVGIGFIITGSITLSTGNSTDSLPYLISTLVSLVIFIGWYAHVSIQLEQY